MKVCYIDEAGCCGALPNATSDIQPVLVVGGLILDYSRLHAATNRLMELKRRFYPKLHPAEAHRLASILAEVKGADLRKNTCDPSRNIRRHAYGFIDGIMSICEDIDAKVIGRVWVKGIDKPFKGLPVYTSSIQAIASYYHDYLSRADDLGIMIADSRVKSLNAKVAHSIFTQKFRAMGDHYDRIVELPSFGHSENHAGLQLMDFLCSAVITPIAVCTYCEGHVHNLHVRPGYCALKNRYATRLNNLQHRYQEANQRWNGGIIVSDDIAHRHGGLMFRTTLSTSALASLAANLP